MSIVPRSDLREHELPDNVQKYRVRYLKASPLGWRPSGSGSLGWRPPFLGSVPLLGGRGGGVPCLLRRALFVLTEAPCATPNHVWGWCRRGRVGFAPTRHPSYSPHLSRLFVGSGPFGFQR